MSFDDYWGFQSNPFDNVPDPTMYFSSHAAVDAAVAELLFAIEGNECLAVVVGEVGLGKTMALRMISNQLDPAFYQTASIPKPDLTSPQLLREVIGRLKGSDCTMRDCTSLLRELNRILREEIAISERVVILIDEGNCPRPGALEGLRQLTNMQRGIRNALTLVLAGQPKLAKMLEDLRRSNLFQRIGVYSRLKPLDTPELVRDYIEHRLERAGGMSRRIFSEGAIQAASHRSEGVPRLINRFCKLSLKATETNGLLMVTSEILTNITARFAPSSRPALHPESKGRNGQKRENREGENLPSEVAGQQNSTRGPLPARPGTPPAPLSGPFSTHPGGSEQPVAVASSQIVQIESGSAHSGPEIKPEPQPSFRVLKSHGEEWRVPEGFLQELQALPDHKSKLRLAGDLADVLIDLAHDQEARWSRGLGETTPPSGDSIQDVPSPEQGEAAERETTQLWYNLREELLLLA